MSADGPASQVSHAVREHYAIVQELGRGGMATVYLAQDLRHDRLVALKVLNPELSATLGTERFLREIRITAQLDHPNILAVLDSGELSGILWYTMPVVKGETLRQRIARPLESAHRLGRVGATDETFECGNARLQRGGCCFEVEVQTHLRPAEDDTAHSSMATML